MPGRDLDLYRKKRDPGRTPEPMGGERRYAPAGDVHTFVVQQHAARRMHWDVRLEIDRVLVSFAVPRGPQRDPKVKHLAVQTEDHPLEYADFEGIIPAGNYGAGAMIVWDRGTYRTVEGNAPSEGLAQGKLDLLFSGHKLRGRWTLVRTKGGDAPPGKGWLLLCKGPPPSPGAPELVVAEPASVLSGLTIDDLRAGVRRTDLVAARVRATSAPERAVRVSKLSPMLAEATEKPFRRDGWLFELKYDGVRVVAARNADGSVELWSRRGRDTTRIYPEITRAIGHLPVDDFVIDGEIVALDEAGRASFERLQRRFTQVDLAEIPRLEVEVPVVLYAFDLLSACGHDLMGLPLRQRKEILETFAPRNGYVRYADHVERDGDALFEMAREHDREGIVAKRGDSKYYPGRRSKDWLKIKVPRSAVLAIVGWIPGKGTHRDIGSVMTAWRDGDKLVWAGNAGSGLDERTRKSLLAKLGAARRETPAFELPQDSPALPRERFFVEPELTVEVRFTETTETCLLRHPVFVRLREDRPVSECDVRPARTEPAEPTVIAKAPEPKREVRLSNLDKVFWPTEGYTKGDLLAYYEEVWPWLAPYLRDRPLVLTRYPDGIEGKNFYQKNAPDWTPAWVETVHIQDNDYFICNDVQTLLHVINSGAIPLHVWSARRGSLDRPDWTILDLDPKGAPFADVLTLAKDIHALLDELGAPHYVKTSGQQGIHILIPLAAELDHVEARTLAEVLARVICAARPEISTVARRPESRGGKVYLDYLQNGFDKLIVGPFSVRPRPGAPVSMTLTWREVNAKLDPQRFTIKTAPERLKKFGDPMREILEAKTDVARLLAGLTERLA